MKRTMFKDPFGLWSGGKEYYTAIVNGEWVTLPKTGENFAALTKMVKDGRAQRARDRRKATCPAS